MSDIFLNIMDLAKKVALQTKDKATVLASKATASAAGIVKTVTAPRPVAPVRPPIQTQAPPAPTALSIGGSRACNCKCKKCKSGKRCAACKRK